jgi:hypothetical protein
LEWDYKKLIKWIIAFSVLGGLVLVYSLFNPENNAYFPKCIFKSLTGFKCPGCGSQRAIHHILNFQIAEALRNNLLLVISIPYIITGFVFDLVKKPGAKFIKWRKILFGSIAIYTILVIIILFWILRNIPLLENMI